MSRQKGNGAEREVAALIKAWWRQVEPKAEFVRTPLSGGWGGPTIRAGFRASGDLMTDAKLFPFTVEVKRREAFSLERLVEGKSSPVWGWWRQAQTQAVEMKAIPMLWLRRNREPWRVMLPVVFLEGHTPISIETWWMPGILDGGGIDYGDIEPAIMFGESLLGIHPKRFALRATTRKL